MSIAQEPVLHQILHWIRRGYSDRPLVPLGYTVLTSLSTISTVGSYNSAAEYVLISPETQAIRFVDDSTTPSTTVGFPIAAGEKLWYNGNIASLKFHEQTASAKLHLLFYRNPTE